jgi:uncharacterized protein
MQPPAPANTSCTCAGPTPARPDSRRPLILRIVIALLLVAGWAVLYQSLAFLAHWLTYDLLGMSKGGLLASAVEFFLYEAPKVLMLLVLVVFVVGIARSFFTPERTRRILAGRREAVGNVLASLLGVVTPFCSCSAVPLFIGFVTTGVPLGVTFSFLISAPMVNEVALVLLLGLFGWKVAGLYLTTGLTIAIISGWVIGRLKLERWVEGWVYQVERMHVDTEAAKVAPYRSQKAIMAMPAIYFVGAQEAVLDMLQGEVTEAQIQPILSTLAADPDRK